MSAAAAATEPPAASPAGPRRRRMLWLACAAGLLVLLGAGLWFGGVIPRLLGSRHEAAAGAAAGNDAAAAPAGPVFADMPPIVANLFTGGKRAVFVKLTAKLELARPEDRATVAAAMPRLLDLFQTYLRETRPDELQGAAGTWRLREELLARANIAASPAQVLDVLFTEMLIQ